MLFQNAMSAASTWERVSFVCAQHGPYMRLSSTKKATIPRGRAAPQAVHVCAMVTSNAWIIGAIVALLVVSWSASRQGLHPDRRIARPEACALRFSVDTTSDRRVDQRQ